MQTIEIPDWCVIGKTIAWNAPVITGVEWVKEEIISFDYNGFFHTSSNCPVYHSDFTEYGKTIQEVKVINYLNSEKKANLDENYTKE